MLNLIGEAERKSQKSETRLTENLYRFLMQDTSCTHYDIYE